MNKWMMAILVVALVLPGLSRAERPAPSIQNVNVVNPALPVTGSVTVSNTSPIPVTVTNECTSPRTTLVWENVSTVPAGVLLPPGVLGGVVEVSAFRRVTLAFACTGGPPAIQVLIAPRGTATPLILLDQIQQCGPDGAVRTFEVAFDFVAVSYGTLREATVHAFVYGQP